MKTKLVPFLVTLILGCAWAGAQAAGTPQRSPELQRLVKALSGTWSIAIRIEPSDQIPGGGLATGEEVWTPGPGGLSLIENYHSTGAEGEMAGIGVAWWDVNTGRFQVTWCDNTNPTGCTVLKHGAKWEGDQIVAVDEWDSAGKRTTSKEVFSNITRNSFTQTLYQGETGGDLKRLMTIKATRKPAPPAAGSAP